MVQIQVKARATDHPEGHADIAYQGSERETGGMAPETTGQELENNVEKPARWLKKEKTQEKPTTVKEQKRHQQRG